MLTFSWKREKPGVYVCNGGDDATGGSIVRLAKNDWRVYAYGGGIANAISLQAGKKLLEAALSRTNRIGVIVSEKKSGPISPDEVEQVQSTIPDEVFEAFNEAIAANWHGHSAMFKQDVVVTAALAKLKQRLPHITRSQIFDKHWLDVEPAYEAKGWHVDYDKPGYNESYHPATFTFRKKSR